MQAGVLTFLLPMSLLHGLHTAIDVTN